MSLSLTKGDTRMIIDACLEAGLLRNQCAYVLATAWHESAHTMKPVRETLAASDGKAKEILTKSWKAGKLPWVRKDYWSGGFFGRGYVQLTHAANYELAGKKLGVDLKANPSLALDSKHAAPILVIGMREGWFTGKKLVDYITLTKSDFKGARRIINGTDKAALIAGYAVDFDSLLKGAGYGGKPASPGAKPATVPPKPAPSRPREPAPPVSAQPKLTETQKESVMHLGSTGDFVKELQKSLNTLGYGPLTEDGNFDAGTEAAVEKFQKASALKVDGWAGPRTLEEIGKALKDRELQPQITEAEKHVPAEAKKEVEQKSNWWTSVTGGLTGIGATISAVTGLDWRVAVAIGATGIVAIVLLVLMRQQIIAAFKEINEQAKA